MAKLRRGIHSVRVNVEVPLNVENGPNEDEMRFVEYIFLHDISIGSNISSNYDK